MDKFPFATPFVFASDIGELSSCRRFLAASQNSSTSGYVTGGSNLAVNAYCNTIDKFPFSVDSPASDVAELSVARTTASGQSSLECGYTSGGKDSFPPPNITVTSVIDKFPFASDTTAVDGGELLCQTCFTAGQSSTTSGYTTGGCNGIARQDIIQKFPFASSVQASDVGELTSAWLNAAGTQN